MALNSKNSIEKVVVAVERLSKEQGFFTAEQLMQAASISRSYSTSLLPILTRAGLLDVNITVKPYAYHQVRSMTEARDSGELARIWKSNRNADGVPRTPRQATRAQQQQPQGPQPIELQDPMELLEQLQDDDFAQLISWYLQRQRGEIQPLRDQVKDLQVRLELIHSNQYNEDSKLRHENDTLRRELKDERERIIHLRNELQSANNMLVRKEPPSRIVMVERGSNTNNNNHQEHGGSGNVKAGYVVHGKPYTGHAPASVLVEHKNRK